MRREPRPINAQVCAAATRRIATLVSDLDARISATDESPASANISARRVAEGLRTRVIDDADRDRRLELQVCVRCHYTPRVAGAAITIEPCALCGIDQTYASTSTALLCAPCAATNDLCRHCGGDMDGDLSRTLYPSSDA